MVSAFLSVMLLFVAAFVYGFITLLQGFIWVLLQIDRMFGIILDVLKDTAESI